MDNNNQTAGIGKLPQDLKTLIMKNSVELSAIQGNMLSTATDREIKTILITSCSAFEGKTITAISMAYELSTEANARVLLVDGNLRYPKIHELFNVGSTPGLSDLVVSNAEYEEVIRKTEDENLIIIPHGTKISNPLDLFRSKMFKEKLDYLKQRFNYLIFDTCAALMSSHVSIIAKYFDGIILVIEAEKTRWEILQQAKEKINNVGGNILGAVLNKRKYYIPKALYGKI